MMLVNADCLEFMPAMKPGSVDLLLTDMPYGITDLDWDVKPDLKKFWAGAKHVTRRGGLVVLTCSFKFAVELYTSNPRWFKYDLVYHKRMAMGFLSAKKKPLTNHELVLIFGTGKTCYNPQPRNGKWCSSMRRRKKENIKIYDYSRNYHVARASGFKRYPVSVIDCPPNSERSLSNQNVKKCTNHPTEKPLSLLDYLIRTYSNPGDVVLDAFAGSGSTGIACLMNGRNPILLEKDKTFFKSMKARIHDARKQQKLKF